MKHIINVQSNRHHIDLVHIEKLPFNIDESDELYVEHNYDAVITASMCSLKSIKLFFKHKQHIVDKQITVTLHVRPTKSIV